MYKYIDGYVKIHRLRFSKHLSEGYFEYCMPCAIVLIHHEVASTNCFNWFMNMVL